MPTPESTAAFAKLVATRSKLNRVKEELRVNELQIRESAAHSDRRIVAEDRYARLQAEWDRAVRDLKSAVEEFSATVERLHVKAAGA
jgi:hypothetical protein